jgi:hypothetical protein
MRIFAPKQHDPHPPPILFFSVSRLKGRHFHTMEVIKAELQAMLNTPTETQLPHAFKK